MQQPRTIAGQLHCNTNGLQVSDVRRIMYIELVRLQRCRQNNGRIGRLLLLLRLVVLGWLRVEAGIISRAGRSGEADQAGARVTVGS